MKKQIVQLPQLPAFALPKPKTQPQPTKVVKPVQPEPKPDAVVEVKPEPALAKTEAAPQQEAKPAQSLPANGQELHRRLQDYDAKLASQKLCVRGALLAHVTQAGVKAGYTANMADWTGPAIPFAVDAVKEFEQSVRPANAKPEVTPILDGPQIMRLQETVRQVVVGDHIFTYVADLVRASRPKEPGVPKWVPDLVAWGAGPRASQYLILGGKARAILHGRLHVTSEDIREVAYPVLRHRLMTTFNADAEGVTPDDIIKRLIDVVPLPQEEMVARLRRG